MSDYSEALDGLDRLRARLDALQARCNDLEELARMTAEHFCQRRATNWNERDNCGICYACRAKQILKEGKNK